MSRPLRAAGLAAAVAAAAVVASGPAGGRVASNGWYWTPGLCKSALINRGVTLSNGRYFRAARVQCFGRPTCWIDGNVVRYDHFDIAMLDRNGVVRTVSMQVTGKTDATFTDMRVWPQARWDNLEYLLGKEGIGPVSPSACKRS